MLRNEGAQTISDILHVNNPHMVELRQYVLLFIFSFHWFVIVLNILLLDNTIGTLGMKAIGNALKSNSSLTHLSLLCMAVFFSFNNFFCFRLFFIFYYSLLDNNITNEGLQSISDALRVNTSLERLNLYCITPR
jgi:hypothetical protein